MTITSSTQRLNLNYITFLQGDPSLNSLINNQNKCYFTLIFDNAKPLLNHMRTKFTLGFFVGSCGQLAYNIGSLLIGGGLKAIPQIFARSILKNVAYRGFIGGAMGMLEGAINNELIICHQLEIEPVQNWYQSIELLQDAFEYFLSCRDCIDQNTAAELTDTISQNFLTFPITTRCGHTFNVSQISQWQIEHSTCPTCRTEIGQNPLSFNWDISLKLIKFVHYVIHTVQEAEHTLPPTIFTDEVKIQIINLHHSTNQIMESIASLAQSHFRQMRTQGKLNDTHFEELTCSIHDWKTRF
ncbi:MAG: hypothetical protein QRY71_00240 [Candidatus Rhabdochlamydia sp.]